MNTRLIAEAKTKLLPRLPVLSVGKHRRVFTRHFTNLSLWLPGDELQLLSYLIYDVDTLADNTFVYSTQLLNRFIAAFREANLQYCDKEVSKSPTQARRCLKNLIEQGLILNAGKNRFMISPMITYNSDVVNNKKYKEVMVAYNGTSDLNVLGFTSYYCKLVSDFLESKKKNYKYGKKKI